MITSRALVGHTWRRLYPYSSVLSPGSKVELIRINSSRRPSTQLLSRSELLPYCSVDPSTGEFRMPSRVEILGARVVVSTCAMCAEIARHHAHHVLDEDELSAAALIWWQLQQQRQQQHLPCAEQPPVLMWQRRHPYARTTHVHPKLRIFREDLLLAVDLTLTVQETVTIVVKYIHRREGTTRSRVWRL